MSNRVENPDPKRCVAGIRKGKGWSRYWEQCSNPPRKGSEWCGVHERKETGVLVYGACFKYSSLDVKIESSEVVSEGPKTLKLKGRLATYGYQVSVNKDNAALSPKEALANLVRAEEETRDALARKLATTEARLAAARAAFALEEGN